MWRLLFTLPVIGHNVQLYLLVFYAQAKRFLKKVKKVHYYVLVHVNQGQYLYLFMTFGIFILKDQIRIHFKTENKGFVK